MLSVGLPNGQAVLTAVQQELRVERERNLAFGAALAIDDAAHTVACTFAGQVSGITTVLPKTSRSGAKRAVLVLLRQDSGVLEIGVAIYACDR